MKTIRNLKQIVQYVLCVGLLLSSTVAHTQNDTDYAIALNQGIALFKANNNIEARKKLATAYKLDSLNFQALLYFGWNELELRNFDESMRLINKAILVDSGKSNEFTYYVRGLINFELGKYKESINDLGKAAAATPDDPILLVLLARSQISAREYTSAISNINKSLAISSASYTPYYYRGVCNRELGHIPEAIADFEKSSTFEDREPYVYYSLGELYRQSGNFEKAATNFEKYSRLGDDPARVKESLVNSGICYYFSGSYLKSIDNLEKGMKLFPAFKDGYTYLGMGLLATGDTAKARYNFEKSLQLNPRSPLALHYLGKMEYFLNENGKDHGISLFQQAEKNALADKNGLIIFDLSQTWLLAGDTSKALDLAAKTLELLPGYVPALQYRITINQARITGSKKELIADHDRLIELFKDNNKAKAYYLAYKALDLSRLQLYADALRSAEDAIKANDFSEYYVIRSYIVLQHYTSLDQTTQKSATGTALKKQIFQDIDKALASGYRKKDALMMKASVLIALGRYKEACKAANEAVKAGKKISSTKLNRLCADNVKSVEQWDIEYDLTPYEDIPN
jgi:tetratricopeptide (TPR) repeat protein